MRKADFFVLISITVLAGIFFIVNSIQLRNTSSKDLYVEISVDGKIWKIIPLEKQDSVIKWDKNGNTNIIHIHDRGVEVEDANCPNKLCVKTGFINKPGQVIVCLPHKLVIKIKGKSNMEEQPDAVSE